MFFVSLVVVLTVLVGAPLAANAADEELGKKIFSQRCAMCHGPDGKGNATMAQKLKVTIPDLTASGAKADSDLVKTISEGRKPMPAFGKSLKPEELDAVAHYAKALATGQTAGK